MSLSCSFTAAQVRLKHFDVQRKQCNDYLELLVNGMLAKSVINWKSHFFSHSNVYLCNNVCDQTMQNMYGIRLEWQRQIWLTIDEINQIDISTFHASDAALIGGK